MVLGIKIEIQCLFRFIHISDQLLLQNNLNISIHVKIDHKCNTYNVLSIKLSVVHLFHVFLFLHYCFQNSALQCNYTDRITFNSRILQIINRIRNE